MQNICNVLEISPADLLDTQPESSEPPVASVSSNGSFLLKREDRRPIYCMGDGFRMEALLEENRYDARIKVMTINGVFQERMTSAHRYDSFGIVASGKLGIKLADGTYFEVSEGECIMVRAEIEHVTRCLSEQPCVSYWIDLAPKKYTEEEAMNRIVQDDAGRIYEIRPIR